MKGQFDAHGSQGTNPASPSQFASDLHQVLGDNSEPDARFLEESWLFGMAAALDNRQRRREQQGDRERQSRAFRYFDRLRTISVEQDHDFAAESLLADRAAAIASRYDPNWSAHTAPSAAATAGSQSQPAPTAQSWTPQDWKPQDRVAQSWIPQGWRPEGLSAPIEAPRNADGFAGELPIGPMNRQRACRLLGVASDSTAEQIRSAYRRMVGRWHPDRLQLATEAARRQATEQMAAFNEAYRMLREETPQSEAA